MNDINCIFCKISAKIIPSEIIFENEHVFAFLDNNPVNKGHTLVIPKAHTTNIFTIAPEDLTAVMEVVRILAPRVKAATHAGGINVIMNNDAPAGQVVFHSHTHIIPRFENDGFRHWHGSAYGEGEMAAIGGMIRAQT
jgi:histidine triad (HIT) family protein